MEDIIYCEHSGRGNGIEASDSTLIIIQTLCDPGQVFVGDKAYPMTYGGLYFINGADGYTAAPDDEESYAQSSIVLSTGFLSELSEILECTGEIDDIFFAGGYYVPIKNYKTIDERLNRIASTLGSGKRFSKALIVADLLQLLNYAVYTQYK